MDLYIEINGDADKEEIKEYIEKSYLTKEQIKYIITNFGDILLLEFSQWPYDYYEEFIDTEKFNVIFYNLVYNNFSKQQQEFLKGFKISSFLAEHIDECMRDSIEEILISYVNEHLKEDKELSLRLMQLKMQV